MRLLVNKKNHKNCNGIEISFNSDGTNFFVDEVGIIRELKSVGSIRGQEIKSIDLKQLERGLKSNRWIADAQLFFDNKEVLQVIVREKEPVARIFTTVGRSFYIDSACKRLPLSDKLSARIPMFTNFPSDKIRLSRPDSMLMASVKDLALFIQSDDFWKAQVAQVDITADGFEMIPTIGNHVVELGKSAEWQKKFDRLFSFYKQVWTQVGFEKYERLDVQFEGQVVATIKGTSPAYKDSAKSRMAYENLLTEVKLNAVDSLLINSKRNIGKFTTKSKASATIKTSSLANNDKQNKLLQADRNILRSARKDSRGSIKVSSKKVANRNVLAATSLKTVNAKRVEPNSRSSKAVAKAEIKKVVTNKGKM